MLRRERLTECVQSKVESSTLFPNRLTHSKRYKIDSEYVRAISFTLLSPRSHLSPPVGPEPVVSTVMFKVQVMPWCCHKQRRSRGDDTYKNTKNAENHLTDSAAATLEAKPKGNLTLLRPGLIGANLKEGGGSGTSAIAEGTSGGSSP